MITLDDGTWRSPPVLLATSFSDRLVGIRRAGTCGLLIRCRSVHAVGVGASLRVVHLDGEGAVVGQDVLATGRHVHARGVWILELPLASPGPEPGTHLVALPSGVL